MTQADLRAFIERYFSMIKAERHEDVPGVFRFAIPSEWRSNLNASTLRVTFEPSMVEKYDGVELLTPGSLLLERILEDASSRGHHGAAEISVAESHDVNEVVAANLRFRAVRFSVTSVQRSSVQYFLLTFRATLVTDERTEFLEHVLVNSRSLREHKVDDLFFDDSLAFPDVKRVSYDRLDEVYSVACGYLESRLASETAVCIDNAQQRLETEENRIQEYFAALTREARESKYPDHAEAAIATYEAEESKRLEEARLKYQIDANVRLVAIRTVIVPTTEIALHLICRGRERELQLEYDEVGLEIPPPACEGCGSAMKELGMCDRGHIICIKCEQKCALCDSTSCLACAENLKVSKKCSRCGRLLCSHHAIKDDFGLATYCPEHIVACSACGRQASRSFVARCDRCSQLYCFLCVTAKDRSCKTCRSLVTIRQDDEDVMAVKSQTAFAEKYGKWRKGKNKRFTILEGRSILSKRTFVLDEKGKLVWEG